MPPGNESESDFEDALPDIDEETERRLLERRIVCLDGEIGPILENKIKNNLWKLYTENPLKKITLLINSPGGRINEGFLLHDLIFLLKTPIIGIAYGKCFSMAVAVLQGCTKRFAAPNTIFLVHSLREHVDIVASNKTIVSRITKELKQTEKKYIDIITRHTPSNRKKIEKIISFDNGEGKFLFSEEAKKIGLIDDIINEPIL